MSSKIFAFAHLPLLATQPTRHIRHKPWLPKFRLIRQMQPWTGPIDLSAHRPPATAGETPAALRAHLRRNGLLPPLIFRDNPITIGHSGQVTDPYTPPEGDGHASVLSLRRVGLQSDSLLKKGKSYRDTLKIRRHEPTFNPKTFASEASEIYQEAHELLQDFKSNESRLLELVTEKAFSEMTKGLQFRTLRWQFIASLEPPRVVHIRTQELMSRDNLYGQVTVRFHSQQVSHVCWLQIPHLINELVSLPLGLLSFGIMAIFDRFGRLLFGNPAVPVDVLEYVVLEKHISDEYGIWRLHAKIFPPRAPPLGALVPTHRLLSEQHVPSTELVQPPQLSTETE
ncbi:Tim44-like domain protein [Opisthorchis viverrini]|uniref:Large ribosomal subunit protein mL45 n=1 Tax=Opisthorchis viverrini TaxID=6198 RepID=A0A1S8WQT0_OPIVI|nr:Tim44-like domain protein [Opisthorchis viverrini]